MASRWSRRTAACSAVPFGGVATAAAVDREGMTLEPAHPADFGPLSRQRGTSRRGRMIARAGLRMTARTFQRLFGGHRAGLLLRDTNRDLPRRDECRLEVIHANGPIRSRSRCLGSVRNRGDLDWRLAEAAPEPRRAGRLPRDEHCGQRHRFVPAAVSRRMQTLEGHDRVRHPFVGPTSSPSSRPAPIIDPVTSTAAVSRDRTGITVARDLKDQVPPRTAHRNRHRRLGSGPRSGLTIKANSSVVRDSPSGSRRRRPDTRRPMTTSSRETPSTAIGRRYQHPVGRGEPHHGKLSRLKRGAESTWRETEDRQRRRGPGLGPNRLQNSPSSTRSRGSTATERQPATASCADARRLANRDLRNLEGIGRDVHSRVLRNSCGRADSAPRERRPRVHRGLALQSPRCRQVTSGEAAVSTGPMATQPHDHAAGRSADPSGAS